MSTGKLYFRIIRCALLTVITVSGVIIGFRTLLGPFTFLLRVSGPVNPEGSFGLALVLMMLVTADAAENTVATLEPTV